MSWDHELRECSGVFFLVAFGSPTHSRSSGGSGVQSPLRARHDLSAPLPQSIALPLTIGPPWSPGGEPPRSMHDPSMQLECWLSVGGSVGREPPQVEL